MDLISTAKLNEMHAATSTCHYDMHSLNNTLSRYERMVNPLAFPDLDSGVKTEHKLCEASPGEDKSEEDESSHVPVLPTAAQL